MANQYCCSEFEIVFKKEYPELQLNVLISKVDISSENAKGKYLPKVATNALTFLGSVHSQYCTSTVSGIYWPQRKLATVHSKVKLGAVITVDYLICASCQGTIRVIRFN